MSYKNIVVVGATGLVGIEFVELLGKYYENYNLDRFNIILISNSHIGKTCFNSYFENKRYISMDEIDYSIDTIFINCANSDQAKLIVKNMSLNSILIDNSSEFRMNINVPLIIPEINWEKVMNSRIISNPNCSTIILAMLLDPFIKSNNLIKRIVVSTYQSASGAGKEGLEELQKQTKEYLNKEDLTTDFWKQQYIYNTFVHNSPIENNLYCQEENKLINETNKIFNSNIKISATCIRVPVLRSHCESVNIEFYDEINYSKIIDILKLYDTIEVIDNKEDHIFPSSISTNNNHIVQIGHIRPDYSLSLNKGWNFWISGDQLLRGASYNALLIMRNLVK